MIELSSLMDQAINLATSAESTYINIAEQVSTKTSAFIKENGFWYQLSFSLLSASIFFIAFNTIPKKTKSKKLRPIVIRDLCAITHSLFFLFCAVMQEKQYSSSGAYQTRIRSGKFTLDEMKLGFQNKYISENDLTNTKHPYPLMAIGKKLQGHIDECEKLIERLFNLSDYVTPDEIIIAEDIRSLLNQYKLNFEPTSFKPLIPSCDYLSHAYYPLYQSYLKLQSTLIKEDFKNDFDIMWKASYLADTGEYKKCLKFIKTQIKLDKSYKSRFSTLEIRCNYLLDKKQTSYKLLSAFINSTEPPPHLVSYRQLIVFFRNDTTATKTIKDRYGEDTFAQAEQELAREDNFTKTFELQNLELSKHYQSLRNAQLNQ